MPANLIETKNPFQTWIEPRQARVISPLAQQELRPIVVLANYATRTSYTTNRQYMMKHRKIRIIGKDTRFSNSVGMGILWVFPQVFL